jgi:hypothetical protein
MVPDASVEEIGSNQSFGGRQLRYRHFVCLKSQSSNIVT